MNFKKKLNKTQSFDFLNIRKPDYGFQSGFSLEINWKTQGEKSHTELCNRCGKSGAL